jgi:hypothetical protein
MGRLIIGAIVAGVVMFVIGYIFYGSPLMGALGLPVDPNPPTANTLVAGYVHMVVSALALAMLLWVVRDRVSDLNGRMQVVVWASLTTVVFTNLGTPIWMGLSWGQAIYDAVAGFLMLVAAGYVLARWFVASGAMARPATA